VCALISEHGAVDSFLSAVVNELSPSEHGIRPLGSQDNFFPWADEQLTLAAIGVSVAAVMPLVECEAIKIAILG